jgi:hypothetical protein
MVFHININGEKQTALGNEADVEKSIVCLRNDNPLDQTQRHHILTLLNIKMTSLLSYQGRSFRLHQGS